MSQQRKNWFGCNCGCAKWICTGGWQWCDCARSIADVSDRRRPGANQWIVAQRGNAKRRKFSSSQTEHAHTKTNSIIQSWIIIDKSCMDSNCRGVVDVGDCLGRFGWLDPAFTGSNQPKGGSRHFRRRIARPFSAGQVGSRGHRQPRPRRNISCKQLSCDSIQITLSNISIQ